MPTTSNFGWTTPADTDLVKDGAAAIRTLGNGIDTSLIDLKGGTTGQILSKASNTDLDYTWIANDQGDITEVQAGTGISVASGTGPIPVVTNTVATTFDAKGDLVAGTGADTFAKLTVGANDTVLTADSTTATGLKWSALTPAYNPNYALINTGGTALTGAATITVSGISAKKHLFIIIAGGSSASANSEFSIRFNSDTAANYFQRSGVAYGNSVASVDNVNIDSGNTTSLLVARLSNNAGSAVNGVIKVSGCDSAGLKVLDSQTASSSATANSPALYVTGGYWSGSASISSVSIISAVGNFDAGTIYVYGA